MLISSSATDSITSLHLRKLSEPSIGSSSRVLSTIGEPVSGLLPTFLSVSQSATSITLFHPSLTSANITCSSERRWSLTTQDYSIITGTELPFGAHWWEESWLEDTMMVSQKIPDWISSKTYLSLRLSLNNTSLRRTSQNILKCSRDWLRFQLNCHALKLNLLWLGFLSTMELQPLSLEPQDQNNWKILLELFRSYLSWPQKFSRESKNWLLLDQMLVTVLEVEKTVRDGDQKNQEDEQK